MAGVISFVLIAIASMVAMAESRVIPAVPISVTLDAGNSVMFPREKKMAVRSYPHRTMMFTGYYRPIRRTSDGGQATGVFAQGNAVSGEALFKDMHTSHLKGGPKSTEESEVSSAEAQAAQAAPASEEEQEHEYHRRNEVHRHEEEKRHREPHHDEEEQFHRDEPHYHHHHRHHQDSLIPQGRRESEQIPLTTETAQPIEKPIMATEMSVTRPKMRHTKKTYKTPATVNTDNDDDDESEMDEEDDEAIVPFVSFKGDKRRYPHLNNFFPMIFSFPRLAARAGSSESLPGAITAIANSYSTGKGGVASSVATAYGGSPIGKKRRPQAHKE